MTTVDKGLATSYGDWLGSNNRSPTRSSPEAIPASVLDWATIHRRIEGRAFSLDRFLPLKAIYADDHPHICVMKPAQRGVSEWAINRACFALIHGAAAWKTGKDGLNVAYLFPTQIALGDFSRERISALKEESPTLGAIFGGDGFDGVTFKQIGHSYLYLRGAWSEKALLSFAADLLVLDEYDRMDPAALALARRRLNASPLRHEIDVSTPTMPGRGIHAQYMQSDQRVYEQECPRCGFWRDSDFFRDVRVDGEAHDRWKDFPASQIRRAVVTLVCPSCGADLDEDARVVLGRWTARDPAVRSLHGYHVPALPFPMTDLARLAVSAVDPDPTEQAEFWRSDLGIPFDAAGARLTPALIHALDSQLVGGTLPHTGSWRDVTMGVDVGARFHFRISGTQDGRRRVRAMGTTATWGELDKLMTRYQVRRCVVDALPELHAARTWAARFPGRVLRAFYPAAIAVARTLCKSDDESMTVQINRTMAHDAIYAAIVDGDEDWPTAICRESTIVQHLCAPTRVVTKDQHGQEIASWEHTLPDHYFHACIYDRIAHETLLAYRLDHRLPVFASGAARGW